MRINYSIVFLIFLGFIFATCSNDNDEPTPTKIFTISRAANSAHYADHWFVAWDNEGTLLDYKEFVDGETLTLSTTKEIKGNKVTLGRFRHYPAGSVEKSIISIITDLEVGRNIVYDDPLLSENTYETFKLAVDTLTSMQLTVSSKNGASNSGSGLRGKSTYDIDIPPGSEKFIITIDHVPNVYAMINNVKAGDDFYVRPWDFTPFENEVTFNFPSDYTGVSQVILEGLESGQSLDDDGNSLVRDYSFEDHPASYTTGYFDGITNFRTNIGLYYGNNVDVYFNKTGSLPGTIDWPDPKNYTIDSSDPRTFAVLVTEPVEWINGFWTGSTATTYSTLSITSPQPSPTLGQVPDEIIGVYPQYEIRKDLFTSVSVSIAAQTPGSDSYQLFSSRLFSGPAVETQQTIITLGESW